MCKCDWCPYSKMVNGKLVCPWSTCSLTQHNIEDILKHFGGKGIK